MVTMFDGEVFVQYGFVFLNDAGDEAPDLDDSRAGQVNGLLGAAVPGALALMFATHTGSVPLRVEWSSAPPTVGDEWDDVVEASLDVRGSSLMLSTFDDFHDVTAPATGPHRARLNATGMDAAREQDSPDEGEQALDRYLLQLWPAAPMADRVVRQGSRAAAYWHGVAQASAPISDERAARHAQERERPAPVDPWTPTVDCTDGRAVVNALPLSAQAETPSWLARRACEAAGIAYLPWVRDALHALRTHGQLPGPFQNSEQAMVGLSLPSVASSERARQALDVLFLAAATDPTDDLGQVLAAAQVVLDPDNENALADLLAYFGFNR